MSDWIAVPEPALLSLVGAGLGGDVAGTEKGIRIGSWGRRRGSADADRVTAGSSSGSR
jgi:hypothetical protein